MAINSIALNTQPDVYVAYSSLGQSSLNSTQSLSFTSKVNSLGTMLNLMSKRS